MKKKLFCIAVCTTMLVGCGGSAGGGASATTSEDAYYIFTSDLKTIDYFTTQNASDGDVTQNLVDGLVEKNPYAGYSPCLAEKITPNEDFTEWTFTLRDATWVTNEGEEYAPVTADDFVAGLQHLADFQGQTLYIAEMFIEGLADYSQGKTTDFSKVGVKAGEDGKSVTYTLTEPTPYFESVASYTPFYPVSRTFLEEQGEGCKLGNPDPTKCDFGNPSKPGSILYNGPFILDHWTSKSEEVLRKNEAYWDKDNVFVNKITWTYDDGSDSESTVKGFQQETNPYYQAVLLTTGANFEQYLEQFKENAYNGQQNQYTFGINFNMNRITFTNSRKTSKQQEDTKKALLNTNFRKALKFGLDRSAYLAAMGMDPSIADAALRNIECPWEFVITSDGTPYGKLVQEASEDPTVNLEQGQDSIYNPEKSAAAIAKAKEEMPEIEWPVVLDLLADEGSQSNVAATASLEDSIEKSTGGLVDVVVHPVNDDVYTNSAYTSTGPVDADWDISTSTGWGYDYVDPKSYLNIFSPVNGDVLRTSMGLEFYNSPDSTADNKAAIEACGLLEYQKMLDEAYAITDDMDARYKAEAAAEAFLLDQAIYIPVQTQGGSVNWRISRVVPFTGPYQSNKFKWVVIQKDPITKAEYDTAYENWKKKLG